jgi:NitT/TauT family transport system substrate-binding protein
MKNTFTAPAPLVRSRFLAVTAGTVIAAGLGGLRPANAAGESRAPLNPPVKIKIGVISALFDSGSLIAYSKGYFREEGLDVDVIVFPSSSEASQAVGIGQIDVFSGAPNAGLFNAQTQGIDVRVVASAGENAPGHGVISLILRKDVVESGRYKTPADLKGMKIATGITQPSEWLSAAMAAGAGLAVTDVDFVSLGFANTIAAMSNKAIEGGSVNEPFATSLIEQAGGVRVASMDKFRPRFPAGYLLYGTSLTKTNREAGRRYMIAYLRGLHDYKLAFGPEKKNTADVVALLKKYNMTITPETPSMGVPDDGAPSFTAVPEFAAWLQQIGAIKAQPDLKGLVDDSYRQYAISRVKLS